MPISPLYPPTLTSNRISNNALQLICALVFSIVLVNLIFWLFPTVWFMAANADSLVLLDFARDILHAKNLKYWNLPRAPYLFPDTAIALVVMLTGWLNQYSLILIASINFCLLSYVGHSIYQQIYAVKSITLFQTQLALATALLLLGVLFPVGMTNLYWQIFASGAHFLTAIMVALIMMLTDQTTSTELSKKRLMLIGFLCFSQAISDSLSLVLLASWWTVFVYQCRHNVRKHLPELLLIPLVMILGTFASFLLPRQDLVGSFFSLAQFTHGWLAFWQWANSAWVNSLFLCVLLATTLLWPWVSHPSSQSQTIGYIRSSKNRFWALIEMILGNSFVLPSLAIFCLTPLFYQEVGSLRYLSFPGLLGLLTIGLLLIRFLRSMQVRYFFQSNLTLRNWTLGIALAIIALGLTMIESSNRSKKEKVENNFDQVGLLAAAADANDAAYCIAQAAKQYSLQSGIATYWSARPIRFATNFQYFLAQTNPWRPRSGHFVWGNNALDFVYQDYAQRTLRQYNFVIASHHEIAVGLWKSLSKKSTNTFSCANHTLYFYQDPAILWDYLFPFDIPLPAPLDSQLQEQILMHQKKSHGATQRTYIADELLTVTGENNGKQITATGKDGFLVFGPYVPLDKGAYQIQAIGELHSADTSLTSFGAMDVVGNGGKQILFKKAIPSKAYAPKQILQGQFELDKPLRDVEFRLYLLNGVSGQFERFEIQKLE